MTPTTDFFQAARVARGTAIPCTREHAMYCLEVVPPVYAGRFFGLGEPYSHEDTGVTRHWIMEWGESCFCTFGTQSEARSAFDAVTTT